MGCSAVEVVAPSIFKGLRPTAGQGPKQRGGGREKGAVRGCGGDCGCCCPLLPHLDLLLAQLRHTSSDLASVLAQTKRKRKKPEKNQWKTQVFGNHLGARLAHLGGYVGPSWGYVDPSWGYLDPAWGLCWPILTLCWPMLAHLGAMLAQLGHFFRLMLRHVDPS